MTSICIETVVESNGELHLSHLPYQKGDRVEAMITLRAPVDEQAKDAARQRFLARARRSLFCSSGCADSVQ
jgi:hypothetical protein